MPTANFNVGLSGGGMNISRNTPRTADGGSQRQVTLPVGKTGTLTTRTDADTGTLTMASGHAITTGQIIDLYWSGGRRYGVVVGTVSVNSVPIDLGAGDNLPTTTTPVVACVQVQVDVAIDGDGLSILGLQVARNTPSSTAKAHLDFQEEDDTQVTQIDVTGNEPQVWDVGGGSANPFTGDPIAKMLCSNGSATEVGTLKLIFVGDTTP